MRHLHQNFQELSQLEFSVKLEINFTHKKKDTACAICLALK